MRIASARGFTLLEILLALTIAVLITAVAVPNFAPLLARAQLYSAARDIGSGLRFARGQALSRGRETEFELDVERHFYRVTGRNKPYKLSEHVRLSLFTADAEVAGEGVGRVRFYPDGSSTGGRITLDGGGQKRLVDVSWLTGEVRIRGEEGEAD